MGQRLIAIGRHGVWAVALVLTLIVALHAPVEGGTKSMSSNNGKPIGTLAPSQESLALAQKIMHLKEIPLPDEWYTTGGATLAEHFEATAKAMRHGCDRTPTGGELMARYANHGEPFVHAVWFNQPLPCRKCTRAGADGFYTVVSVRLGLSVKVSAGEMHEVLDHQGVFPGEKLMLLRKILSAR